MRWFLVDGKTVHLAGPNREFTICGDSYDLPHIEFGGEEMQWHRYGTVNCSKCVEVIRICEGVSVSPAAGIIEP